MHNDAPDPQNASSGDFVSRIETELLRTRKVLIFGDINDRLARDVCSRLLLLADRDASEPMTSTSIRPAATSNRATPSTTWSASSGTTCSST